MEFRNFCGSKNCIGEKCDKCIEKSFVSHPKSIYLIDKSINPRNIALFSHVKYDFICNDCNHVITKHISQISRNSWCGYCESQFLCSDNNCNFCKNNSFAINELAKYWSSKNTVLPRQVMKGTHYKYYFDCPDCKHELYIRLDNITYGDRFCKYCANKALCDDLNCKFCDDKSFNTHKLVSTWSPQNKVKPRFVLKSSQSKYYFICESCKNTCHIVIYYVKNHIPCSLCYNKTEKILYNWLKNEYPNLKIIHQANFDWCISLSSNKNYLFDFLIEDYNIIIELDGEQHFKQVANWKSPENTRMKDVYKMKLAYENGYTVIRLLQEYVYMDKLNWDNILKENIKKYDEPCNIFISAYDEYDNHINDLTNN